MNPDTAFLMDLLLEPAQNLRRELGASYDLVCVPEAEAAAKVLIEKAKPRRPMAWYDPRVSDWVCSLHDRAVCEFCGVSK